MEWIDIRSGYHRFAYLSSFSDEKQNNAPDPGYQRPPAVNPAYTREFKRKPPRLDPEEARKQRRDAMQKESQNARQQQLWNDRQPQSKAHRVNQHVPEEHKIPFVKKYI